VSKFHLIWCPIAQVWEERGGFWEKITFLETSYRTMPEISGQCSTDSFSSTFVLCFGRILLTECPFDPIPFPLAL
jgi:hypothetical protein